MYLEPGTSLKSSTDSWYKVVQHLGTGGNALTFLVVCTSGRLKGIFLALKIFRRLAAADRRDKFLEEIEFLTSCEHPSVMRVFDEGVFTYTVGTETSEYPFVVAEYLPRTLRHVLREGSVSMAERISYSVQLLSALSFLEGLAPQVVHRDIKPENVFVKGGSCVLGDFGLLKQLDGQDEPDREVFKESTGPGMPFFYRTPDLVAYALGTEQLTVASDVFQLGLVLAEMFTGRNPCKRPPDNNHLVPVELEELGRIPGSLSGSVSALLHRMLVPAAADRPSATTLMDGWMGLFDNAANRARELDGHVL